MVLGGQLTPFCFYPLSSVTRNCETHWHQQLRIHRAPNKVKPDFPSNRSDVFRTISFSLTTSREKKRLCRKTRLFANSVEKKTWRWLATQNHGGKKTLQEIKALREFCCEKTWRWLATQNHANTSIHLHQCKNSNNVTCWLWKKKLAQSKTSALCGENLQSFPDHHTNTWTDGCKSMNLNVTERSAYPDGNRLKLEFECQYCCRPTHYFTHIASYSQHSERMQAMKYAPFKTSRYLVAAGMPA